MSRLTRCPVPTALLPAVLLAAVLGAGCAGSRLGDAVSARPGATAALPSAAPLAFTSDEGVARFARATAKTDFARLANQFEAQSNGAFCGPATAAIVLNAIRGRTVELPRDRSRLSADDLRHLPPGADLTVPRYTQDNVIEKGAKTRARVLGEPLTEDGRPLLKDGRPVRDFGYQLRQFDEMLRAHGLVTRLVVVDDSRPEAEVREALAGALRRPGEYAIVNYRREAVGQRGGGHISPLGAYDDLSDSFLVLDVNPTVASWVWLPTSTLVAGMRTFDTVENRGYIVVTAP